MKAENSATGGSRNVIVLTVLVVVIIGIITAVLIYADKVAPFQSTVLEVDDASIKMRYFLKRMALGATTADDMFKTIASEEIIRQIAPQPPYNLKVTEEDIDSYIRTIPAGEDVEISDDDFKVWYRGELKKTGLSTSEYRELVLANLLRIQLTEYLAERVPTVAPQVQIQIIPMISYEDALDAKERLDNGEDFLQLGKELVPSDSENPLDIDLGWYPRGVLPADVDRVAFNLLEAGEVSDPILVNQQFFAIVKVAGKAAAREVDEQLLNQLKSNVLPDWLDREMQYHRIIVRGLNNGYDAETEAWVRYQLQK